MANAARLQYPTVRNDQGGFDVILQAPRGSAPAAITTAKTGRNAQAIVGGPSSVPPPPAAPLPRPRPDVQPGTDAPPMVGDGAGAPAASSTAAPSSSGNGIISGPIADYIGAALGGVDNIDTNAAPLMQMAQGAAGAYSARSARADRKLAEQTAAEEKQYQRGQDAKVAARDERKLALDEARSGREERSAAFENVASAAGIELKQAEIDKTRREIDRLGKNNQLTPGEMLRAEEIVANRLDDLWGDRKPRDDAEKAKYFTDASTIRADIYREIRSSAPASGSSATGGVSSVPKGAGGAGGDGSQAQPLTWSGSGPASPEEAKALLDGALKANGGKTVWFRNPADGRVLPYP